MNSLPIIKVVVVNNKIKNNLQKDYSDNIGDINISDFCSL